MVLAVWQPRNAANIPSPVRVIQTVKSGHTARAFPFLTLLTFIVNLSGLLSFGKYIKMTF